MKFGPITSACIFLAAMLVPTLPFVVIYGSRTPSAAGIVLGMVLISAIIFWAGARVARQPHTVKSLALAILVTWAFSSSTTGLSKGFFSDVAYVTRIVDVVQFAFVFLVAWRLAPRTPASAATPGNDAAV